MKKLVCFCCILMATFHASAQHDPNAIKILNRMVSIIGDLDAFSFSMNNCKDLVKPDGQIRTICNTHDVYVDGPTRMLVKSSGDNGDRDTYYDGYHFNYYNVSENNYITLDAPPTLMETLDTLHKRFDFDFPAADFFYPTLTADLMEFCKQINYAGTSIVNGINCHLIVAENNEMTIQIWIRNDAATFPQKMVITYKKDKDLKRYESNFSQWNLDHALPVSMFDFLPSPTAKKIAIMANTK